MNLAICLLKELDRNKIKDIFTELEFRNLSKRVLGEELVIKTKPDNEDATNKQSQPHNQKQTGGRTDGRTSNGADNDGWMGGWIK